jgi:UDP-3-O-[3-hydroxymyristoyl] glucosamine N-acyltransferase
LKLEDIAKAIDGELFGDDVCQISGVSTVIDAKENHITFILEKKYFDLAKTTKAKAIISYKKIEKVKNQIIVKNPRKALAQVISLFSKSELTGEKTPCISDKSSIDPSTQLSGNVRIDDFVKIEKNSEIGDGTYLASNVTIGKNCKIGNNCTIYANVILYDNTEIGNRVIIHSGAVIGSDGFGYYEEDKKWYKIPHIGKAIIKDDVEIGANTCIDRGCLGNTIIGKGTKIDNLTHIAHNTLIGENCAIAAQFGSLGGSKVNNSVQIGGQVGISKVEIGKNAIIAGRAGVTKDVPENAIFSGFPAWEHGNELKKEALLRKLVRQPNLLKK